MGPKISAGGASGGGQLPVPANAFIREDGVITAPPGSNGGGGAFPTGLFTLTDAPTIEVDASAGSVLQATLNGDRTLGTPSNPLPGQPILFEFIQGAGGNFTLGFSDAYAFPASIPQPALSTTEGQRDFLQFTYDALVELWQCTGWVPDQNAGTVAIPQGGTGQDSQQSAINALAGAQTSGYYLRGDGENVGMAAIEAADLPLDSTASDIQPVGTAADAGDSGKPADAGHVHTGLALLDSTGAAGYTLVSGGGTVLSWTVPDDGQLHRFIVVGELVVSSAATGGALALSFADPGGAGRAPSVLAASQASGFHSVPALLITCQAGQTVTVTQSALTGGAAIFYGDLWGL